MPTKSLYARPPAGMTHAVSAKDLVTSFNWEYDEQRPKLVQLYDAAKKQQWDAAVRLDWSQSLDPENPMVMDDMMIPIFGTDLWRGLSDKDKAKVRRHQQAHTLSQFMHGEQGALMAAAKLVQMAPNVDEKHYAATQAMDEARHVEVYARLLHEKFELVYPITPGLKSLLDMIFAESRWDFAYLGMQVLIEGLALAAFQRIRDASKNQLAAAVNAYVMQDEARHVSFGRIALRDYYPKLSEAERAEREEFVVQSCYHMRDRFDQRDLWGPLGFDEKQCVALVMQSEMMKQFRHRLFSRIVPTVKDIGLWSPKVQKAFAEMGAIQFAEIDIEALLAKDQQVAAEFDAGTTGRFAPRAAAE
ncbi:MAG: ferritin-like domain-containing protein [Alphaproteobacteria bacterium]|nr:ferritin-like domain-containing protein [Alphaproteobacteria bacterium]